MNNSDEKGKRVLALRLEKKLSQTEFGRMLTRNGKNVSQNYLSAIESGRKPLGDDVQARIEARFKRASAVARYGRG